MFVLFTSDFSTGFRAWPSPTWSRSQQSSLLLRDATEEVVLAIGHLPVVLLRLCSCMSNSTVLK